MGKKGRIRTLKAVKPSRNNELSKALSRSSVVFRELIVALEKLSSTGIIFW